MTPLNKLRKIKLVEIVPCFCIACWLFLLLVTGTSRFSLPPEKVLSLKIDLLNIFVPAFICCLIGIGINYSNNDNTSYRTPFPGSVLSVFILVFIDQMIKFALFSRFGNAMPVVSESYGQKYLDAGILNPPVLVIVKDWVFIQPLLHKMRTLHGWFVLLLAGIGLPFCYRYSCFMKADRRLLDKFIIIEIAMIICYWIDKLVYKGSIDYIRLVQFAVFDLKDIYGMLALAVLVQAHIHNRSWQMVKKVLAFKGSFTELKEYINYERTVIKNIPIIFKKNSQ
jgi:hypothetical protein